MAPGGPVNKKLVVIGDGAVGKTCLLMRWRKNEFPEDYVPTIFENSVKDVTVDGVDYRVDCWDTAGQEDYDRLRPLSYPDSNMILMCFSVLSPDSLSNIKHKEEIEKLQSTRNQSPITYAEAESMGRQMKVPYFECSALTNHGVEDVFAGALRANIPVPKKKKGGCSIL